MGRRSAGIAVMVGGCLAGLAAGGSGAAVTASQVASAPEPDGAALYRAYCASCHGTSGRGDGPVAEFLRIAPTDLTSITTRSGGAFPSEQVHRAIDGRQRVRGHGATDMPVWGDTLSPSLAGVDPAATRRRIELLVQYIASIQRRVATTSTSSPATHGR